MKFAKKIIKKIFYSNFDSNKVITIYPNIKKPKGRVLFSYLVEPVSLSDDDARLNYHSNMWESREIVRIFKSNGYIIDVINYDNFTFYPTTKYDIVFDIHHNLQRLVPFLDKNTIKILHITGSYPGFSNKKEIERLVGLEERKGIICAPRRLSCSNTFDRSLNFADVCSLIGNELTLKTFPEKYIEKIKKVTVSTSKLSYVKDGQDFVPEKKEFLWFFGSGAVHKGLDLVLEVFARNKNMDLNVVGGIDREKDFYDQFKNELLNLPNIKYYGVLRSNDIKFKNIIKKSFAFIAPSCSEGISPAVATCLQLGLFPILSKNTGIDLPNDNGIYLDDCTVEEIEKAVYRAYNMQKDELKKQIYSCQNMALKEFSREAFTKSMSGFLGDVIKSCNVKYVAQASKKNLEQLF